MYDQGMKFYEYGSPDLTQHVQRRKTRADHSLKEYMQGCNTNSHSSYIWDIAESRTVAYEEKEIHGML